MTFSLADTLYDKITEGDAFVLSELFTVAGGGTANIHLENPTDSGKKLWVTNASASGTGEYKSKIHDKFSSGPSNGTEITIENMLLDYEDTTVDNGIADANRNATFTSSGTHTVSVAGGAKDKESIGVPTDHPTMLMENSRDAVIEITNTTTAEHDYSITIVYFETTSNIQI